MSAAERLRYALQMARASLRRRRQVFRYGGPVSGHVEVVEPAWRRAAQAPQAFRRAWTAARDA